MFDEITIQIQYKFIKIHKYIFSFCEDSLYNLAPPKIKMHAVNCF